MHEEAVTAKLRQLESTLWSALDLDTVGARMAAAPPPGPEDHQMGTGHTHNACFMCSNSAATAGCGTCG